MNRILFEPGEISGAVATFGGARAEHVLKVLHGEIGQRLKTGEIGGKIGFGEITAIEADDTEGCRVSVRVEHGCAPLAPWADLVLAPPRPRVLKRLLPQLAALGVGTITLVGAKKTEKDFWGATLLKEEIYRPLFIDGLMQCAVSTQLPILRVERNFRRWLREGLDAAHPAGPRVVAHPNGVSSDPTVLRDGAEQGGRMLLAVGPEGGWVDEEVELMESKGFVRCSLGPRILRTDTALIALLSRFLPDVI